MASSLTIRKMAKTEPPKPLLCCDRVSSRLATSLCGIPLKTPVLAASGTFAYGVELRDVVELAELGGIITKGLSREPMEGNPAPRLYETEAGMMKDGVMKAVQQKM